MTDDEPIDGARRLPDWVERELDRRRQHWTVLRDGGLISATEEADSIHRETEGLPD